jgi:hypothetical protein
MKALIPIILAVLLVPALRAPGQTSAPASPASEQQRLLELKAAWVRLQNAASERDRYRRLLDLGLCSESDHAAMQTAYQVAQVAYQQSFLTLFAATPRLSVARCVKSYDGEAGQYVTVTLRNSSAPALDYRSLGIVDETVPLPDMEQLRELHDIAAWLTDADGVIISEPYEQRVPSLAAESSTTLRFGLLKDVDWLHVQLRYAGLSDSFPVYLEKDRRANRVRLQSQQFSLEANLGTSATYDLRLESYSGSGSIFALRVFDLPQEIGAELIDPATGARLTHIKFTEGVTSRPLQLRVFLPDLLSEQIEIDQPVSFLVAALGEELARQLPPGRDLDPARSEQLHGSSARLELVPRGVGRLEVSAPTLLCEIEPEMTARLEVHVRNIGTRRVDNVRLHAGAPADWQVEITPAVTPQLEPGAEVRLDVVMQPPSDVPVGDYPVRLRTEAYADNHRIESLDQNARIQVKAPPSYGIMALLAVLLLGIIGGLVAWGVRMTRR